MVATTDILSLHRHYRGGVLFEFGEYFGVTRERIRQIQEEALQKLRAGMEERDHPSTEEATAFAVAA